MSSKEKENRNPLKIFVAEYLGEPTYLITDTHNSRALWRIVDGKTVWTNRFELAFHDSNRTYVEGIISQLNKAQI